MRLILACEGLAKRRGSPTIHGALYDKANNKRIIIYKRPAFPAKS